MPQAYLSGSVYYREDVNVTDVQTIMDNVIAMGLASTPPWTNPLAGKMTSPLDADGRQFSVQFTRISATNLEYTLTDGQARTLTRRAQIAAGGSTIHYYLGQFHMVLDWLNSTTPEGILCVMLDESPESQTSHNRWMVSTSSRNAANTNDSGWTFGTLFVVRSANTFAVFTNGILGVLVQNQNQANNGMLNRTLGGSNIWTPIIPMGDSVLNVYNIYGRLYQCLNMKSLWIAIGSEVSVPVDQATSVIFKMLQMPSWTAVGQLTNDRMAVRKT